MLDKLNAAFTARRVLLVGGHDRMTLFFESLLGALGARPARAMVVAEDVSPDAPLAVFEEIAQRVPMGGNLRASEAYRRKVAPVLMQRAARACVEGNHDD